MTLPSIPRFRNEQAPHAPAFYVDVDPTGERIDPTLVFGDVDTLEAVKGVIEQVAADEMTVLDQDLQNRIDLQKTGHTSRPESDRLYEGVDLLKIKGQSAFILKGLIEEVAEAPRSKYPQLSRRQRRVMRVINLNTLKRNQIPDSEKIDEDQAMIMAEASNPTSGSFLMFPDEHGRYDI